ncbi:hypothetical protein N5T96_01420 [Aliarcobacter butzleri]|uniref:hypothetical protein n=1 Tax=Aliarcobacter butzleri TaxID=28197 RepID=UPI0021B55B0F|nr:hypothetical protein [Aliarcobacter butzleri]MCT7564988.1 hypothetical protein [Aliarcobacter butzleri]
MKYLDNIDNESEIYKDIIDDKNTYRIMLDSLIKKYGLLLTTNQTAEVLSISTRTLDEKRKAGKDCPEHLPSNGKNIYYPVQKVVEYQLLKSNQCIKIY